MSLLDGTPKELTYGEALCAIVEKVSWPTELIQREVLRAVQKEHDLVPPDPDVAPVLNDSRDVTLANQDKEIAELKAAKLEALRAKEAAEKTAAEAQALLAQAQQTPAAPPAA